jgi:hypothetical protein
MNQAGFGPAKSFPASDGPKQWLSINTEWALNDVRFWRQAPTSRESCRDRLISQNVSLIIFRKSTFPRNCQLDILISQVNNKLTVVGGVDLLKPNNEYIP